MDDYSISTLFIVLGVLLFLSAFFSGSETALMALNRYRLRHLANKGNRGAHLAQQLLNKPDRLIGLILLGNNIVNLLASPLAAYLGYRLYGDGGVLPATALFIAAVLIFAEVTPKTLAALHTEKFAFSAAYIYTPLQYVAYPLVFLINSITNNLLRVFGVSLENKALKSLSADELRTVVTEAGGLIPAKHQNMLISILDLESIKVEDIMIPRNEVLGVDIAEDWDDIRTQIVNAPFTRMPVYQENLDNIIGFLHLRKIFPRIVENEITLDELRAEFREPYFIPESTSLNTQLLNFQREKRRIGLVVDEYGDIQGLVTLEDLLEEIVGEFTNDPATFNTDIYPQEDGSYVIDAGTHVRDVNKALKISLSTNGPRTINGLVLEHLETIPETGTTLLIDGYPIEIVHMLNNSVRTVRIKPQVKKSPAG
ncbi:MAG: magnesium/cobalt efflux protein [Gammaproteobacteria bacterium TMED119]|nr:MAG: magnesium/cobalt efflux protein [Gammaproteobacteria bacterium TMED119]RCL45238.1 MAG: HlyC/CorC family transporter [Candidatus Thioglobus sp.]